MNTNRNITVEFRDMALRGLLVIALLGGAQSPAHDPPTPPTVTITASDPDAAEVGPDTGTFTVTRTGDLSVAMVVYFQTPGGTAQNGVDYQTLPAYVPIPAYASTANVTLTPILDSNCGEGNETVVLTLATNANYWVGWPSNATVTITDLDSDCDGLPDAWEVQYFTNLDQSGSGDYDGDGVTNYLEYLQGGNPTVGRVPDTNNVITLQVYTPLK